MIVRRSLTAVAGILLAGLTAQPAVADTVAYYRYRISLYKPGPPTYAGRVASLAGARGRLFAVSTDALGRVTKVVIYRDGVALSETDYQFSENARYSRGGANSRGGEMTGKFAYTRDANGYVTREDDYTSQGALTSYTIATYAAGRQDFTFYAPSGTVTGRETDFFSPEGRLVREQTFPSDTVYGQEEYDTTTGLETSSLKFENGKLAVKNTFTYDSFGDVTRVDHYDPITNKPYGFDEFADGLKVRSSYHFLNGDRQETLFSYDAKRILSKTTLNYNGTLICTFTYDRQTDGTIKRTLANGPNGDLYAEFPNALVTDVYRNGSATNGAPGTIYKTGDWY